MDVVFLGTAGSVPTGARGLPALLVRRGGEKLLIDCGEGTQRQLLRSVGLVDLEEVFLTHYHADHVLGLPGMVKSFSLRAREAPLTVYGPPGLRGLFEVFSTVIGRTTFEIRLVELDSGQELERDGYRIAAFETRHGVRSLGYALLEHERPGRLDVARASELGVSEGPDLGRLQAGETVVGSAGEVRPEAVLGEPRRGRRLVITGDTAPSDLVRAVAHEADLLIHEATFTDEDLDRAVATLHSTARQAAELAAEASVRLLALTHLSPRRPVGELQAEARAIFEQTIVPRDFDRVELPLPERGGPVHHRARDGRRGDRVQPEPAPTADLGEEAAEAPA